MLKPLPFAKYDYRAASPKLNAQRVVNLYCEIQSDDSVRVYPLLPTPGLVEFAEIGTGPIRALDLIGSTLFAVSGDEVYEVSSAGVGTLLGNINVGASDAGTTPVYTAASGTQMGLVAPPNGWGITLGSPSVLARITDGDFLPAAGIVYLDGYFICPEVDSRQAFFSALLDVFDWDPLDVFAAESGGDNLVAITSDHRELWLQAQKRMEVWYNAGVDPALPFERIQGAYLEKGVAAAASIARLDNSIFWLANDLMVYRIAGGYGAQRISTHAIEHEISEYADVSDAWAWTYSANGHIFYVLTFPSGGVAAEAGVAPPGRTFVYDVATQMWHERQSGVGGAATRWRPNCGTAAYGRNLCGDSLSGKIFTLTDGIFTEDGNPIERIAVCPPLYADGQRVRLDRVELECQVGVGLTTGQGSDPQVVLDWSDDGGVTWSNELWRSLGALGQRERTRVRWNRLGQFRNRSLRFRVTDPVQVALYGAVGQASGGRD
jgi:hypothetical protein